MTLQAKRFTRKKEDFTCGKCGFFVIGDGYTNHCPKCLWCKHVDINPGDRANDCCGLMEPYRIEGTTGKAYTVLHKCLKCGAQKPNKIRDVDDIDAVLAVIAKRAKDLHRQSI